MYSTCIDTHTGSTYLHIQTYVHMYVCILKEVKDQACASVYAPFMAFKTWRGSNVRAHVFLPRSIHHHCRNSFLMFWLVLGTLLLHQPVYRTQTPPLCKVLATPYCTHAHTLQWNVSATATIKHHKKAIPSSTGDIEPVQVEEEKEKTVPIKCAEEDTITYIRTYHARMKWRAICRFYYIRKIT